MTISEMTARSILALVIIVAVHALMNVLAWLWEDR